MLFRRAQQTALEFKLHSSPCEENKTLSKSTSTGDLEALKKETFVLKEGVEYRVKIHFKVSILPCMFL